MNSGNVAPQNRGRPIFHLLDLNQRWRCPAGFEHCVANMYFLPLAWLMARTGNVPADFDASVITMTGIIHNLVPVTLGNIVGGAGLVGAMYWMIYRAAFGESGKRNAGQG